VTEGKESCQTGVWTFRTIDELSYKNDEGKNYITVPNNPGYEESMVLVNGAKSLVIVRRNENQSANSDTIIN